MSQQIVGKKDNESNMICVIDNGGEMTKAGFSGEKTPRSFFSTTIATDLHQNCSKGAFVGEANSKPGIFSLRHPIEHGVVTNWNDMENIWHHTFYNHLRIDPEEHGILLTEAPLIRKEHRERTIQIMFETFRIRSYYVATSPVLSMYASGGTTGMVIESGDGVTSVVPIYEGICFPHAIRRLDLSGRDITEYLEEMLKVSARTDIKSATVKNIKEKLGYVALNYNDALKKAEISNDVKKNYDLPDGQIITIGAERFKCPEILFQPNLFRVKEEGIHKMVFGSIMKCDPDIHSDLFNNIVLSGGSTMFPGMVERMQREMIILAPKSTTIKIIAPPERKYSAWIGGSILSSFSTFEDMCISKDEYKDVGPSIVHRKCT